MNKEINDYLNDINKNAKNFTCLIAKETSYSYSDAQTLVGRILRFGNLENAKQEYNKYGIAGLKQYINIHEIDY